MYDGTFYNDTNGCALDEDGCGLMELYDVGMTSMFVQEALSLSELAKVIGRPQSLSDMLTARGQAMAKKISVRMLCYACRSTAWHDAVCLIRCCVSSTMP